MNAETLEKKKKEITDQWGAWRAHNIQLHDQIYTIENRVLGDGLKLRRIMQIIADFDPKPVHDLTVLDLGCLEGLYAIELARQGAKVIGVEGRRPNIEKARFAKEALSLDNVDFVLEDVRNLSPERHGHFDVVLCLGILYHLDVPDVFRFLGTIAAMTDRIIIIDTHVSIIPRECCIHDGKKYWGRIYYEFYPGTTEEEKATSPFASLTNEKSFWFTRPSLYNLLKSVGFTSIYECHNPREAQTWYDRVTLVAVKGDRAQLLTSPLVNSMSEDDWSEGKPPVSHAQGQSYSHAILWRLLESSPRLRRVLKLARQLPAPSAGLRRRRLQSLQRP
jgi:SAM-dependent methyltransferase